MAIFLCAFALSVILCVVIFRSTHVFTIAVRECKSLLFSPLGYWVLLCFSVFFWYLYQGACERLLKMPRMSPYTLAPLLAFFGNVTGIALLIMVPTITMKLFPEEKALGTFELLLTYPVHEWQIIIGKFLGAWLYYAILWIPSVFQVVLIGSIGPLDLGQVAVTYLWLLACGGGMLAMGLAVSCLFHSQLASFVTTFTLLLPFVGYIFLEKSHTLSPFYINSHLKTACRGTLDSRPFLLYISLAVVSLFVAGKIIEARRWWPLNLTAPKNRLALTSLLVVPACWLGLAIAIFVTWGLTIKTVLAVTLLALPFLRWTLIGYLQNRNCSPVFGANVAVSIVSLAIIAVLANYLGQYYLVRLDCSFSQAFILDSDAVSQLQAAIPKEGRVEITAMFAFTQTPGHEHLQRDNERYFVLKETFDQLASSVKRPGRQCIHCGFAEPDSEKFRELKSRYQVEYREVLLRYQDRHYIISDAELFDKKLEESQVPKLLVLWRKIYEAGGISEPPPDPGDKDSAYEKLKEMANPEMLAVYPVARQQQVLINAVFRLLRGVPRRAYFLQGNGEKWISGKTDNQYRSAHRLSTELCRRNFEVCPLNVKSTDKIPSDCDILVILGTDSRFPYSQKTLSAIDRYLQKGGRIVVFLSATSDPGIISLLKAYGIYATNAIATWYDFTRDNRKMLTVDIPIHSIANPKLERIVERMRGKEEIPPVIHLNNARIISGKSGSIPILRIDNPKIFPDSTKTQKLKPPYYLGAVTTGPNGWKLAVVGNTVFISDSPSDYYRYLFGDPTPRPHILVGSNRFFLPALLEYLSDPLPVIPVKSREPLRFYPQTDQAKKSYFWNNLLVCLLVVAGAMFFWLHNR